MIDEQPNKDGEVTPKGAVEVNDEDLDRAAGGLNNKNPELTRLAGAGATATPLVVTTSDIDASLKISPDKKI